MVFFVCEACNESLKKNKVESHSYSCRSCWILTCVDCNKQFTGETYAAHVSCVSEAQRYEGKLYDGRANKGEVKQAAWIDGVRARAADPSVDPKLRPHIERLLAHTNIPRKRAKFENFAKNSLRLHDAKVLGALWNIFEGAAPQQAAQPHAAENANPGGSALAAGASGAAPDAHADEEVPAPRGENLEKTKKKSKREKKEKKERQDKGERDSKKLKGEKKSKKRDREALTDAAALPAAAANGAGDSSADANVQLKKRRKEPKAEKVKKDKPRKTS